MAAFKSAVKLLDITNSGLPLHSTVKFLSVLS